MLSGVTDPYQPIESKLGITRACLQVFLEVEQPVTLITKSRLILRDLDLLGALHAKGLVQAAVSITSIWSNLGFTFIIITAALQSIPNDLYESSQLDGARSWMRFTNVTVPMLGPKAK